MYGSRVKWTSRPQSDLDLVVFATPEQRPQVGDLREAFEESNLPFRVDLFVWDDVPDSFRKQIQEEHVVLVDTGQRDMSDEWVYRRLEDCMESIIDYRGKTPRKTSSGIPLITAKVVKRERIETPTEFIALDHYASWMRRGMPQSGDVLITTEAPLGEVAQLQKQRVALAQRLILLRGKSNILDNRFLRFLLQSDEVQVQLRARATGTTVLGIKQKELRQIEFSLPPIPEQRTIAHILGTLDDKIELNRRMNATLEAMARALFRSWFVDFDPVRAKMEGRDPGLPKDIADLFPDRLVDSELGEIPDGWNAGSLGAIVCLNSESWRFGHAPQKIAYVDLSNTKWGCIEKVETHAWEAAPSRARRVLRKGDTIVATVRPGNGSFALVDEDGLTGSTGFAVLRPLRNHDRELVWCAATSSDNIDRLAHLADGGAYPAIRPDAILAAPLVLADCVAREAFRRQLVRSLIESKRINVNPVFSWR